MSQRDVTLNLEGQVAHHRPRPIGRRLVTGQGILLVALIIVLVYLSLTLTGPVAGTDPAAGRAADAARWEAAGTFYQAKALGVERGLAASSARWSALGEQYATNAWDSQRSAAINAARWEAMAGYYTGQANRAAAAMSARYQAMADFYTSQDNRVAAAATARYQAMAEWYGATK